MLSQDAANGGNEGVPPILDQLPVAQGPNLDRLWSYMCPLTKGKSLDDICIGHSPKVGH